MGIKLSTNCNKCIHKAMCRNVDNAYNAMQKLKEETYGNTPNDDYDWDIMMKHYNVNITFSCPDYKDKRFGSNYPAVSC